jgi:hypothetical protein
MKTSVGGAVARKILLLSHPTCHHYYYFSCSFCVGRPEITVLNARAEAGFLVRVHPDPCLILIRAQIHALLCASKSKFIRAQILTLPVLDKKNGLSINQPIISEPLTEVFNHRLFAFLPGVTGSHLVLELQISSFSFSFSFSSYLC